MGCNQAELQHREESRAPPSARPSTHGTASRARPTQEQARTAKPQTPPPKPPTHQGRAGGPTESRRTRCTKARPSAVSPPLPTADRRAQSTRDPERAKRDTIAPHAQIGPSTKPTSTRIPPNPLRCAAAPQPQPPRTRRRGRSPRDEQERLACPLAGRQRVRTAPPPFITSLSSALAM